VWPCLRSRGRQAPSLFLALDGARVVWTPKAKDAAKLKYQEAMRLRRRFVGGNLCMEHAQ